MNRSTAEPVDADIHRSASHRQMADHLTVPLRAGAVESPLTIGDDAVIRVVTDSRHPMVLIGPAATLAAHALEVTAAAPGSPPRVLRFDPGSEVGAFLPAHLPSTDPDTGLAQPFTVSLGVIEITDGSRRRLESDEVAAVVRADMVEGIMGRLLYVVGAEKQRIRRQAGELARVRSVDHARDDALDRIGAELGVPRLYDALRYVPPAEGPSVFGEFRFGERRFGPGDEAQITTVSRREPDVEYRRRLDLYRPWLQPTPAVLEAVLNGPGEPDEPNRGLLAGAGFTDRFDVIDEPLQAAFALRLVAVGDDGEAVLAGFDRYLRSSILVWPADASEADDAHADRFQTGSAADGVDGLRRRLRTSYELADDTRLAPMLGFGLDRFARCRQALGGTGPIGLVRAHDPDAGGRYELGLGADLVPLPADEWSLLADRLRDGAITLPDEPTEAEPDPDQIRALLAGVEPADPDTDPDGSWLFGPCGLPTSHRIDADGLYVSHVPTFGLAVTGPSTADRDQEVEYQADYHAPGEPGGHVLLVEGVTRAADAWAADGREPWTVLTAAQADTAWVETAVTPPAAVPVLGSVDLPAVAEPADLLADLRATPSELVATFRLPEDEARRVTTGRPEAIADLRLVLDLLEAEGLASALLVVTSGDEVLVIVGGVALPLAGLNLAERDVTRFQWSVVRLWSPSTDPASPPDPPTGSDDHRIGETGPTTTFASSADGLFALIAVGQIRSQPDRTEPYEFKVGLPDGAHLDLNQYEYLMNLLTHVHPIGTRVDTWSIRRHHVDLNGDGEPEPVPDAISRTFRQFRRPRFRGRIARDAALPADAAP